MIEKEKTGRSPFDYSNSILKRDYLLKSDEDIKEYANLSYVCNMALSYYIDLALYCNEINMYPEISPKMHYDYLFWSTRKQYRKYAKWVKKSKSNEDVESVMAYFKVNRRKAEEYLVIMSDNDVKKMKSAMEVGGL